MNIDELEAGPELDEAVAAACGMECRRSSVGGCVVDYDNSAARKFHPSTDLNAAFEAAEKCGLFINEVPDLSLGHDTIEWVIVENRSYDEADLTDYASGPTPAVAICRAIVKLAKDETRHLRQG